MGSIADIEFLKIEGPQIPQKAVKMAVIDRAGIDGVAYRKDALKVPEITLRTIEAVATRAAANSSIDIYQLLIGEEVTIIDDLSLTTNFNIVLAVNVDHVQQIMTASDEVTNYLVYGTWLIKPN